MLRMEHLGALEQGSDIAANPRERHLAQILAFLRRNGSSSRAQIAADCGLGISTMSELIGELRGRQLVSESEPVRTRSVGRPLREVRLDASHWLVAGLHLDEQNIRAKLATLHGEELFSLHHQWTLPPVPGAPPASSDAEPAAPAGQHPHLSGAGQDAPSGPTPPIGHRAALTEVIGRLLAACPSDRELVALEVGLPGAVDRPDGRLVSADSLRLGNHPFGHEVLDILRDLGADTVAVGVDNDCNFAALTSAAPTEHQASNRITVYVGGERGIGGTVVVGDRLVRGAGGGAGEFGHWTVDPNGAPCWCGRRGCLATLAELDRLLQQTGLDAQEAERRVAEDPAGSVEAISARAAAGDERVCRALHEVGAGLGTLLDAIQALLDPDEVIIGGFLGALGSHLDKPLRDRYAIGDGLPTKETMKISLVRESPEVVVDGALVSARNVCLSNPLHFTTGLPLPDKP